MFKMANDGHLEFSNLRILGAAASMEFTLHVHVAYRLEVVHVFCEFQDGGRRPS